MLIRVCGLESSLSTLCDTFVNLIKTFPPVRNFFVCVSNGVKFNDLNKKVLLSWRDKTEEWKFCDKKNKKV